MDNKNLDTKKSRNLLFIISFDGSKYHGWQIQKNALTVQECFQNALKSVLGEAPNIKACSRTDSGVHARNFCISFQTDKNIPCDRFKNAINHFLPLSIVVKSVREVSEDFHARYSCLGKEYAYEIWNCKERDPFLEGRVFHYWYNIDVEKLNEAAKYYIGKHDFTSFCTIDSREIDDMRRTVYSATVTREGEKVIFRVSADGFLYNMVRIMVGTLIRVAQGKLKPEDIPKILEAKNRSFAGPTATPEGLYLDKVFYEAEVIE